MGHILVFSLKKLNQTIMVSYVWKIGRFVGRGISVALQCVWDAQSKKQRLLMCKMDG